MNKQTIYRFATLLVPIICLFLAVGVIVFETHRYHQINSELDTTVKQLTQLGKLIKDLEAQPAIDVAPTIAQSPVEQPDFLDTVRTTAITSHVQLTRWSNTGNASANNATAPAGTTKTALPSGVTPITSAIEVAGSYNDLRHFLYGLEKAPRLLTLSEMTWTRNDKWPLTTLKFNLTRYVEPVGRAPLKAAPAAAAPTSTASTGTAASASSVSPASLGGAAPAPAAAANKTTPNGTTIAALPPANGPQILPSTNDRSSVTNKEAATKGNP